MRVILVVFVVGIGNGYHKTYELAGFTYTGGSGWTTGTCSRNPPVCTTRHHLQKGGTVTCACGKTGKGDWDKGCNAAVITNGEPHQCQACRGNPFAVCEHGVNTQVEHCAHGRSTQHGRKFRRCKCMIITNVFDLYTQEIMNENKYGKLAKEIFYKEVQKDRRILFG